MTSSSGDPASFSVSSKTRRKNSARSSRRHGPQIMVRNIHTHTEKFLTANTRSSWAENLLAVAKAGFYMTFPALAAWTAVDYYTNGKNSLLDKIIFSNKPQTTSPQTIIVQPAAPQAKAEPAQLSGMTDEEWETLVEYINEGDSIHGAEIDKLNLKTDKIIEYLVYPPGYSEEILPPMQTRLKPN